ncbi:MAG: hypothetical protein E7252_03205 [Lachnospira sp.]|nr:hypothetical protein [Lachnospira sp.]
MKKRKILNSLIAMLLVIAMCVCNNNVIINARETSKNGFTYDTDYYDVRWKTAAKFYVKSDDGDILGIVTYHRGVLKDKESNQYVLMLKMVMEPSDKKAKFGGGNNGYGFSEYLSVRVPVMDSMDDYQPVNTPTERTGTLSLGIDGKSAGIGLSYDINLSNLKITDKSLESIRKYETVYDYKPGFLPWNDNYYLANQSKQRGMVKFETDREWFNLSLTFEARFGVAVDNAASPWNIHLNKVYSSKKYADCYINMNE